MRRVGQGIAAVALVGWLGCTLLPFLNPGDGGGPNLWETFSKTDIVLAVVAGVAILSLAAGASLELRATAAVGAGCAAFMLGRLIEPEIETLEVYDMGWWALTILAGVALVMSLAAALAPDRAAAAPAAAAPAAAVAPAVATPAAPSPAPVTAMQPTVVAQPATTEQPTVVAPPPPSEPPEPEPATTAMASPSLPGPGWYPDPENVGGIRLWSGEAWTDEKRDA